MKYLFIFLVIVFGITPAFAQTFELSVVTLKDTYQEGDIISISGKVTPIVDSKTWPMGLRILRDANLIHIGQPEIALDGTYSETLKAQGSKWDLPGEYKVQVNIGNTINSTTFQFNTKQGIVSSSDIYEVDAGSHGTFDVQYSITGGTITDMKVNSEMFALVTTIDAQNDGSLELTLPRDSIDAKMGICEGGDDDFIVLIDDAQIDINETPSTSTRNIDLEFKQGDTTVTVIGTCVIPEFGVIASLVFIVAITSIIALNKFKIRTFP